MGNLGHFKITLFGRAGEAREPMSLLAETAIIAIYRAAALAIETGATDFQVRSPYRLSCK